MSGDDVPNATPKAIREHLARVGIDGDVEPTDSPGLYRIHRRLPSQPLVTIVLPTRGASGTVREASRIYVIEAARNIIATSTYSNLEVIVVVDSATPKEVVDSLVELGDRRVRLLWYDAPFNHSHACNLGVASAAGRYVVLLSDKVEVISPGWIESMLGLLRRPNMEWSDAPAPRGWEAATRRLRIYPQPGLAHRLRRRRR